MSESNKLSKSELELGQKWDRCLSDGIIKTGSGLGVGLVFSLLFFKRRPWPAVFGSGIGLGMAYANCQADFQKPFQEKTEIVKITDPKLIEKITNPMK